MLTFPRGLLPVSRIGWRLVTPGQDAVTPLSGMPQRLFTSGGPCWTLTLDDIIGRDRDGRLALNALMGALKGGAEPILMGPCECRLVPLGEGFSLGAEPETAGSPFADFTAGEAQPIVAAFTSGAALRATTVHLAVTSGGRTLLEGDPFSVDHSIWGRRKYRLITDNGGGSWKIRPPLRQAVSNAQSVDFNRPGCVMRLAGEFAIDQTIRGKLHTAKASFVELERPVA